MSEVKVDTISERTAANGVAVDGVTIKDSGLTIPSGGTLTVASGGTITNSGTASGFGGLVEADQWRLTANYTSTNGDITANLERNDTTGFSLLGTGMTESSGVFSFPSTGYWLVAPTMGFEIAAGDNCGVETYFTVDHSTGPTWTKQGSQNIGNKGSPKVSQTQISATYVVDVTNTTECKIKFTTESMATNSGLVGSTTALYTWWTFIKLADT